MTDREMKLASQVRARLASQVRATPETDAAQTMWNDIGMMVVLSSFARRLERQQGELMEALEAMLDLWHKAGGNESDWAVEKSEAAIAAVKGGTP